MGGATQAFLKTAFNDNNDLVGVKLAASKKSAQKSEIRIQLQKLEIVVAFISVLWTFLLIVHQKETF